ncbi:hypothetical protein [Roseimaritima sediminicola]|uniref:hypothetical protein n=1 Tax=Roseimaritima sediminicola TaxID=2662066 RepID=UPI0012984549|nr:hypothetical protein [Roseimaritima sediminicola]
MNKAQSTASARSPTPALPSSPVETLEQFQQWLGTGPGDPLAEQAARDRQRGGETDASETDAAETDAAETGAAERGDLELVEAVPVGDPQQVREVSGSILDCYRVCDGHSELAGCTLEPRPLLRLTRRTSGDEIRHDWFGGDGQTLEPELIPRLGLDRLRRCEPRLRRGDEPVARQWIATAARAVVPIDAAGQARRRADADARWLAATVVWCRWASGTVAFRFGNAAVGRCSFAGWAIDFLHGRERPEKYRCPITGYRSYDLLMLGDGTLTVPAAVAVCQATEQTCWKTELEHCEVSGARVREECLVTCPITGRRALPGALKRCSWCERLVVPEQVAAGADRGPCCRDCREAEPLAEADPLLRQVLTTHPAWARYRRWRGWEDAERAVLIGQRWGGQLVVLWDRQQKNVRKYGKRGRFTRRWTWVPTQVSE